MSKILRLDTIRLICESALLMGNKPQGLNIEQVSNAITKAPTADIGSFGLFETAAPNYTTYYPDVKAEDLVPAEGDFIEPIFRALSGVVVHKKYNPISFEYDLNLLRNSQKLLLGQTINADHEVALGNAMGTVSAVSWQDSYITNNILVPAGINSTLKIDGKSNPRIARLIQMDPPGIHSTSVTVEFGWEKSHPKMTDAEFFTKLGQLDAKGNMILRNVTMIKKYREISLVSHGADPYAQKLDKAGNIVNPEYAHVTYNSDAEKKITQNYYFLDMKQLGNTDEVKNSTSPDNNINIINPETSVMRNDILKLALLLGVTLNIGEDSISLTDEQFNELANSIKVLSDKVTKAEANLTELVTKHTQEISAIKSSIPTTSAFEEARLKETRAEVLRLHTILNPNPTDAYKTQLEEANYGGLKLLETGLLAQVEAAMPLTCKDCNSHNISRASATAKPTEEGSIVKNTQDAMAALRLKNKPTTANRLHGTN